MFFCDKIDNRWDLDVVLSFKIDLNKGKMFDYFMVFSCFIDLIG